MKDQSTAVLLENVCFFWLFLYYESSQRIGGGEMFDFENASMHKGRGLKI